jgi:parallel beta-helix repeat protein
MQTKKNVVKLRKTILISLLILCLSSAFFLTGHKTSVKAQNRTWTVGHGQPADFTLIQEAISNDNVVSGDTILVYDGVYNESVEINKSLTLIGEDRDATTINGDRNSDFVISATTASNVNIENFTIKKPFGTYRDNGILLASSGCEVSHNNIIDIYDGIGLYSWGNNLVSDNLILGSNDTGISLIRSIGNRVTDNTISNCQKGIYIFSFSTNNIFTDNMISNNQQGVSISYSTTNSFYDNNFSNNTVQAVTDGSGNRWSSYSGEGNYWSDYNGSDPTHDGIGDQPYKIDESNGDGAPLMGTFNNFNVLSADEQYQVTIVSNSTISNFAFEIGSETGNKVMRYAISGRDGTVGFSRVSVPIGLMNYSLLLVGGDEVKPTPLSGPSSSQVGQVYLYFTYPHTDQLVTIISSETWNLLQQLLQNLSTSQGNLHDLNLTYLGLLSNYSDLLSNYSQLQQRYLELNDSYVHHLSEYNDSLQNLRSLMYIFAGVSAVFIATTVYLSSRLHGRKARTSEEKGTHFDLVS